MNLPIPLVQSFDNRKQSCLLNVRVPDLVSVESKIKMRRAEQKSLSHQNSKSQLCDLQEKLDDLISQSSRYNANHQANDLKRFSRNVPDLDQIYLGSKQDQVYFEPAYDGTLHLTNLIGGKPYSQQQTPARIYGDSARGRRTVLTRRSAAGG